MAAETSVVDQAASSRGEGVEVVRWYTRARRFPLLVGRTPDGTQIPGGPYSIPQIVAGAAVFGLGTFTRGIWGVWGLLGDTFVLVLISGGVVFAVGKVPLAGRNPVAAALGAVGALTAPSSGRIAGKPIRINPPRRVRGTVRFHLPAPETTSSTAPTPPGKPQSQPQSQPASGPAVGLEGGGVVWPGPQRKQLTGVQALLAAVGPGATASTNASSTPSRTPSSTPSRTPSRTPSSAVSEE